MPESAKVIDKPNYIVYVCVHSIIACLGTLAYAAARSTQAQVYRYVCFFFSILFVFPLAPFVLFRFVLFHFPVSTIHLETAS